MKAVRILSLLMIGAFMIQSCQTASSDMVELKLNLEEGKTYDCTLTSNSDVEVMGMATTMNMNMYYTMAVESSTDESNVLNTTYDRITVDQDVPMMGKVNYDSDKPSEDGGSMMEKTYAKAFGSMVGKSIQLTMNERGKVTKTEGLEEMVEGGDQQQMAQQANLGEQMSSMSAIFPDKKIGVGDSWTGESKGASQVPIVLKNTYTVKKITEDEVTLDLAGTITLNEDADLGEQMKSAEASGDVSGTMTVDRKTGWTKKAEMKQNITMKVPSMGNMPMEIKSTLTLTTK